MSKLPVVSGKEMIKFLSKRNFRVLRTKGRHARLSDGQGHFTVVPLMDELKTGTLLSILEQCGISRDDFIGGL